MEIRNYMFRGKLLIKGRSYCGFMSACEFGVVLARSFSVSDDSETGCSRSLKVVLTYKQGYAFVVDEVLKG